jgi:very-short-patch-repair endonuclease
MGLRGWQRQSIHVVVPMGVNVPAVNGLVVHHTRQLTESDLVTRPAAPRMTTTARSAVDAARWESRPRTAAGLVLAVIQQRLATPDELMRCTARLGWPKNSTAIRAAILDGSGGADSWAEVEVARIVERAGLPRPRRQVVVETIDGPRRVDLAVTLADGGVLVIEVDGAHHLDSAVRLADAAKDMAVIAAGSAVLRLPVGVIRSDPDRVLAQLVAIRVAAQRRARGDSRSAS